MPQPASRRSFFTQLAAGTALLSNFSQTGSASSKEATPSGDPYWNLVRSQFAFSEDHVPMNAANLAPSPRVVSDRVSNLTRDIDVDCSFNNRAKFKKLLEEARSKVAQHLGVSADEIALVRNTSEANNIINNGLDLRPGDEVVIWDQNHPTNNVAWDVRAARFKLSVRRIRTPDHPEDPDQLLQVFLKALGPRTRVLSLTHVSNITGVRLPIRELSEAAHQRGIYVHIDGAQTWGALDVNLAELNCDSYSASAHKWFIGPKEVGVLFVKEERIEQIWPNVVAPGWGDDIDPDPRGARKFESLGQRDDAALAAVGTTVDFHESIGSAAIEVRVLELSRILKEGLREAGFSLVTPEAAELSGGVCIIAVAPEKRQQVLDRLYLEHGIAGSTAGGLRLCPHLYNTVEHVDRALRGVKSLRSLIA